MNIVQFTVNFLCRIHTHVPFQPAFCDTHVHKIITCFDFRMDIIHDGFIYLIAYEVIYIILNSIFHYISSQSFEYIWFSLLV